MGIFDALSTAVTGLQSESYDFQNISGNIANSQTIGFKRVDTSFEDLIPTASLNKQSSGSVAAFSRTTNRVQGTISTGSLGTYMAISGDGFFNVSKKSGEADGKPTFDASPYYTRRGDFALDKFGYLVNGAGDYLRGVTTDPKTGNPVGTASAPIQISGDEAAAVKTASISYRANLPSTPITTAKANGEVNGELLNQSATNYPNSFVATGTDAKSQLPTINYGDTTEFLNHSVDGGSITGYDAQGKQVNISLRWAKTTNTSGSETWNLYYQTHAGLSTDAATTPVWTNIGTDFTFNKAGELSPAISSTTINNLTVEGNNIGNITLNIGTGGLTQYADANGTVNTSQFTQDGNAAGTLNSVSVSDGGKVVGSFSNGKTVTLALVSISKFNNPDGLKRLDGATFQATDASGVAQVGNTQNIIGGSIEGSNVDISDEYSKMIVAQQAYTANAKVITIADQILQVASGLIR